MNKERSKLYEKACKEIRATRIKLKKDFNLNLEIENKSKEYDLKQSFLKTLLK